MRSKRPRVRIIDKDLRDRDGLVLSAEKVCGKRYLYSPVDSNGNRDWSIDEFLDKLESDAGTYWLTLSEAFPDLSQPSLREPLAQFVGAMHLRNVAVFDLVKQTMVLRDRLYGGPNAEVMAKKGADGLDPTDPSRFFAQMLRTRVGPIAESFSRMTWSILCTSAEAFVTSDQPVTFIQGGIGPKPGVVSAAVFPISPRRVLYMDNRTSRGDGRYVEATSATVKGINAAMFGRCKRFIITGRSAEDVLGEIVQASG